MSDNTELKTYDPYSLEGIMDTLLSSHSNTELATEAMDQNVTQNRLVVAQEPYFNPINIVIEKGIYYVTLYVCSVYKDKKKSEALNIWLGSLKETDHIKLSVSTTLVGVAFSDIIPTLAAFYNTKATVEIMLDQITVDCLGYFYLIANQINKKPMGSIFLPSYVDHRIDDKSTPWKAVHDFYQWIVEDAVTSGRLTQEEGARLNEGKFVIIPEDRF